MKIFDYNNLYDGDYSNGVIHYCNKEVHIVNTIKDNFYECDGFKQCTCEILNDYIIIHDLNQKYLPVNNFSNYDNNQIFQMIKDNSYYITVNNKKANLTEKYFSTNFGFSPKRFDGVLMNDRVRGCSKSHQLVIQNAKKLDLPFVIIFEDDCAAVRNCFFEISRYIRNIPKLCNILVLGKRGNTAPIKKLEDIREHKDFYMLFGSYKEWGSHSYIIFKRGYDQALIDLMHSQADNMIYHNKKDLVYRSKRCLFYQYLVKDYTYIHKLKQMHHVEYFDPIKNKLLPYSDLSDDILEIIP